MQSASLWQVGLRCFGCCRFPVAERQQTGASEEIDDILYSGFFPRILDAGTRSLGKRSATTSRPTLSVTFAVWAAYEISQASGVSFVCARVELGTCQPLLAGFRRRVSTRRHESGSQFWKRATSSSRCSPFTPICQKASGQVAQDVLL